METNLETLPIRDDAPRLVNAVMEVPMGSRNKYEYEPDLGVIMRDRVLPGAVRCPTDYDPAFPGCGELGSLDLPRGLFRSDQSYWPSLS